MFYLEFELLPRSQQNSSLIIHEQETQISRFETVDFRAIEQKWNLLIAPMEREAPINGASNWNIFF